MVPKFTRTVPWNPWRSQTKPPVQYCPPCPVMFAKVAVLLCVVACAAAQSTFTSYSYLSSDCSDANPSELSGIVGQCTPFQFYSEASTLVTCSGSSVKIQFAAGGDCSGGSVVVAQQGVCSPAISLESATFYTIATCQPE